MSVDLEELVLRWARLMFQTTSRSSKALSKLNEDELTFTVDWGRINFRHGQPSFRDVAVPEKPGTQLLFQTEFTNRTSQEQEYTFKAERVTRSTADIVIEKGVSLGTEICFKLATPCEVFEANAGFHRELTFNNTFGETLEEELCWSVDSNVRVPARHCAHAKLLIDECKYNASFQVHSTASGRVRVQVHNPKDHNHWVQDITGHLADIVRHDKVKGLGVEKQVVSFDTFGTCNFRYGIKQYVDVCQRELPDEE